MSNLTTRVSIPEEVLFRDLGDEAIILELATGRYYGLDETGSRMWLRLRQHGEVEGAYRALCREYDVSDGELRRDLLAFVDRLATHKLVELQGVEPESRAWRGEQS